MSTTSTTSATSTTGATPTQLDRTDTGGSLGQDAFLKLLVAQMQHQDPMAPTDSSQMMSQMAQFTSVEQLTNLSTSMTALQLNQDFAGSVSLIGRSVTYRAADKSQVTGTVSAVTADKTGAILTVDGKQVPSGNVVKVQ
jgi:flagellar basal-body rod modification protein FlgD